jgi:inhibitor of KinA sporulation pathway (predicted exonuclease)
MFICCDLEGTCWDSGPLRDVQRQETEIIEIGAVRMSPDRELMGEFQTFVRPQRHPELSAFCTRLTGITQAEVDAAPDLPTAMAAFAEWIGDPQSVLVSWGAFDRNQIRRDCRRWKVPHPLDLGLHINAKEEYSEWARGHRRGRHGRGLKAAVLELELPFTGSHHRAIDDARNLAAVFARIRDPRDLSPEAALALPLLRSRGAHGTHVGHLRDHIAKDPTRAEGLQSPRPRQWWRRVQDELVRLGHAELLPDGRGLVPTQ